MMITEKEFCGITHGPITVSDFLDKRWITLVLPNGHGARYVPPKIDFFTETMSFRNSINEPQAHLTVLTSLIKQWKETNNATIYAILLFGSSVRYPKTTIQKTFWGREKKSKEEIFPNDVDVMLITDVPREKVAKIKPRQFGYTIGDGSSSWTEYICALGFDVNGLTEDEFLDLTGDFEHECQIPNNVLQEGVLIAGESSFSPLLKSSRKVIWNERLLQCLII